MGESIDKVNTTIVSVILFDFLKGRKWIQIQDKYNHLFVKLCKSLLNRVIFDVKKNEYMYLAIAIESGVSHLYSSHSPSRTSSEILSFN